MNKTDKPLSTLWGCELSDTNKETTFKTDDTNHQHQLALRTMCLGEGAKGEFNIVELITGEPENGKSFPMATLHANGMPTVNLSGIDLFPPVTFRLKSGTGPVYVCGEHVALEDVSDSDEEIADEELEDLAEEEDVEEEEEDIEESPPKPVKKTAAKKPAAKNGTAAGKRKKPEAEDDGPASDEENPPKKGKGRGRKKN